MLASRALCTGCAACANTCHKKAIKMVEDEFGFLYPVIEEGKCIECGLCEKTCPILRPIVNTSEFEPSAYLVQHKDDAIRKESTSGGMFTAIAQYVIENKGIVFGAAFCEDNIVRHIAIDKIDDLGKFRNSKYVQSQIGESFTEAKKSLEEGRLVCFSGTPCQIQGLKCFLKKDYHNLISVDIRCRAVPSPLIFQKYMDYQKKRHNSIEKIVFRDKEKGYSCSTLALYDKDGRCVYRNSSEIDPWLRLFLGGFCDRISCYNCKAQPVKRISDFTLWDCWQAREYAPELDDNKGTTNVLLWNPKAIEIFNILQKQRKIISKKVDSQYLIGKERENNRKPRKERDFLMSDCRTLSADEIIKKYAPITWKVQVKSLARKSLLILHLHDIVRNIMHKAEKDRKR